MHIHVSPRGVFAALVSLMAPLLVTWSPAQPAQSSEKTRAGVESRQSLRSLLDEEWQYELREDPESATALGDARYNDHLSDYSVAAYNADLEQKRRFLQRFEAIDPTGL